MKSNLPAVTATDVNEAHRLARSTAENAVQYAVQCGRLLVAKKAEMKHGEFQPWIERHCDFAYSTASRYMKAAQNSTAVEISTLSRLFPSGRASEGPKLDTPKGTVSVVNPEPQGNGTEETGADRPAAPAIAPTPPSGAPAAGAARFQQGRAAAARLAHNQEVAGSNPAPATTFRGEA